MLSVRHLCWGLVLILYLSQHTVNCAESAESPLLQSGWHSNGLSSSLMSRSAHDGSDLINFDDMPDCAKKGCLPLDPSSIGCSTNMTKACYCAAKSQSSCAANGKCVLTLFWQWLAHVCLAIPLNRFDLIPTCARTCIQREEVYRACSLQSWDCFCATSIPSKCLTSCTPKDKLVMEAWRTNECTTYESGGPIGSTPSSTTASEKSTTAATSGAGSAASTVTVTPSVSAGSGGAVSTVTVTPSIIPGPPQSSTVPPSPTNSSPQQRIPSMAMATLVLVMIVFQIVTFN